MAAPPLITAPEQRGTSLVTRQFIAMRRVDITAYKKGLMLARQAAQPSCQLRWCGGGALGEQ